MARLLNLALAPRRPLAWAAAVLVSSLAACASDDGQQRSDPNSAASNGGAPEGGPGLADAFDGAPSTAARLSVRPIAVRRVPGKEEGAFDLEATRVLAAAVKRATGAVVIDEQAARESFERCEDLENNCTSPLMNDFVNATWVVSARVDVLGGAHFASGQVWKGSVVEHRSNQQGAEPLRAVAEVGWELGAVLRPLLVAELEAAAAEDNDG